MAYFIKLLGDPRRQFPVIAAAFETVKRAAVGVGGHRNVIVGFCPALYFNAVYSAPCHFVKMLCHAKVVGVQNIGALVGLGNIEILTLPLFLHKGITPAAGLGAVAAVGIAPCHIA